MAHDLILERVQRIVDEAKLARLHRKVGILGKAGQTDQGFIKITRSDLGDLAVAGLIVSLIVKFLGVGHAMSLPLATR